MDRIVQVKIRNVRAIESADVQIGRPMTVLIGENGSGKSTVIECLELLRKAAEPNFMSQFYAIHRGMPGMLRRGATSMELGITVEDDDGALPRLEYRFVLGQQGAGAVILEEHLKSGPTASVNMKTLAENQSNLPSSLANGEITKSDQLYISYSNKKEIASVIARLLSVLRGIETHIGFDSVASWAARTSQRPETMRAANTHFPAERLQLLAANLANAWSELLNRKDAHRAHTMELARLGLGERLDSVIVKADAGGGNIYLAVQFRDMTEPLFAASLSDGQLAWLAFVAMARLNSGRSLLVIDEPELHLHPSLLGRVISLLSNLEGGAPVLISTHADRVLELIDDPADAIRVCALEGGRAAILRLDREALPRWLEEFGDLAQLRASGYLPRVLAPEQV